MKKLFPEEKGKKESVKEFLDKKGFYIVLLLCISIVAGTAVFVTTRGTTSSKPNYDAQNIIPEDLDKNFAVDTEGDLNAQEPIGTAASVTDQKVAVNDPAKPVASNNAASSADTRKSSIGTAANTSKNSTGASAKSTVSAKSSSTATVAPKQQNFIMPVFGEVTFEYAKDKLVYSKTLEEWRTHAGIDLAADRGTPVKAVGDGVISEIKNDPRYGYVVIIDHKNGLQTVYSSLAGDDMVAVNQKVKQGEIIGSVGNTAFFESAEQSHLHFEVLKNNIGADPTTYLPDSQVNN